MPQGAATVAQPDEARPRFLARRHGGGQTGGNGREIGGSIPILMMEEIKKKKLEKPPHGLFLFWQPQLLKTPQELISFWSAKLANQMSSNCGSPRQPAVLSEFEPSNKTKMQVGSTAFSKDRIPGGGRLACIWSRHAETRHHCNVDGKHFS